MGVFGFVDRLSEFGELSVLVFASSLIAILGFMIAALYIRLYTKRLYVDETPRGWKIFFTGLILMFLYQVLKVPFTYNWIYGDLFTIVFLIFQIIAIFVLVYGLYELKKEVQIG